MKDKGWSNDTDSKLHEEEGESNPRPSIPDPAVDFGFHPSQNSSSDEVLMTLLQHSLTDMQYHPRLLEQLQLMTQPPQSVQRPREQFLTIANNGTILGATETVTGFLPDSLLMNPV